MVFTVTTKQLIFNFSALHLKARTFFFAHSARESAPISILPRCMECRRGLRMRKLSVCPSVCQTRALWQNGRKICPYFIPYERSFSLVFWAKEWLVGGDPFYLKFLVNRSPLERNRRFLTDIGQ